MSTLSFESTLYIAAHTFAIVCIFDGVRRVATFGFSRSAAVCAAFGFLCCIGYSGFSYWAHNYQVQVSILLHKGVSIPELAADWGAKFPPQQRAETSLTFAKAAFSAHGQIRYYYDGAGARRLFPPTQTDLDEREKKVAQLAQLDYAAAESAENPARWLFIAFTAAIFGFGWSRGQSANPPLNADARQEPPRAG